MENSQTNCRNRGRIAPAACLIVIALVCFGGGSWLYFDRLKTGREGFNLQSATAEERAILSESAKARDPATHDKLLSRMKKHLESSASELDKANAAAASHATWLPLPELFQAKRLADYDVALARVGQEKVLSFQIRGRPTIERHRTLLHAFLAANEQLPDLQANAEDFDARAELEKAICPYSGPGADAHRLHGTSECHPCGDEAVAAVRSSDWGSRR